MSRGHPGISVAVIGASLLGAGVHPSVAEEPPRAVRVIDVDTLKKRLNNLALFDVRPREVYVTAHLPLSFPLDLDALVQAVLSVPAPSPDALREVFGRVPLQPDGDVAIYDHNSPARRDCTAAWLMAYAGIDNIHVLDGGYRAWFQRRNLGIYEGQPIPWGVPTLNYETLEPRTELRVDPAELADGPPPGSALFEVLPYERLEPGSAPAAADEIRFNDLMDPAGLFVFPYHLENLLQEKGVEPDSRILLQGPLDLAAFGWAVFTANGFDAAVVHPLLDTSPAEPGP